MTREEAIEIEFKSAVGWASHMPETEIRRAAAETIDCYVALGMLKLDEPKSPDQRLATALVNTFTFDTHAGEMKIFRHNLDLAGLKIVEK